ncbi:MAG: 50S ribosomal protein L4 [Candidatus Magasanikbacteria bacterium RIFCSPHIGHO2_01_FULL_41_23]|uniref:Large ribosomal subunit protein uL4 n=1 Tax=Candidatus Magasanikbacteria bacterium RIFCSPLOWO2_01_FULL_40_15 TaxID=1798686 RepID=A0A1F6N2W8_9BACT|nr:MAG: 50S ribosomal protein L4 [Candidatus Magasanikbacteria bacterium RIFCSPHIGHO2_01_FULL_41_23]OGH66813.1 MAG: 50S ribosomal protein L4 [Candidatus Magasanikbacteria bacterium RIFCSPHIGHO2_02_FULL_41_35]OGH76667.1 MAG: 50S ribosomal protein L4 [Candidatus Magasanikbacteria bacterium RIFCSPHIGHO2_12_FULL_41_16]OGH78003.1 MAG: 50S ribosomal protein L4 [Candidatus Magasanikbacteria bacterium RIFCSPLOWO2_01_FULL_40_15]
MANVKLFSTTGSEKGMVDLAPAVFDVAPKIAVVHQVYLAHLANARESWADTKDRSQVSGGGKKPWKQKGTGRARHGSIRSPIWKGGGVTFGPLSARNYTQKINKKTNTLAVRMCLSDKCAEGKLAVVDVFPETGKTKNMNLLRAHLPGKSRSLLIVTDGKNEPVLRAAANMKKLAVIRASDVSVVDLLNHQFVVASEAAIRALEKRLK